MPYSRVLRYGDNVEITEYDNEPAYYPVKRERKPRTAGSRSISRRLDNLYRTRRSFLRLVASNLGGAKAPFLATLTMFEVLSIGALSLKLEKPLVAVWEYIVTVLACATPKNKKGEITILNKKIFFIKVATGSGECSRPCQHFISPTLSQSRWGVSS